MKMDDKQLDNLFRSKLEGFEQKPPAWVWDGIQAKQAEAKRNKRFIWFRYTAIAAALVLAFLVGRDLQQPDELSGPKSSESLVNEQPDSEQKTSRDETQLAQQSVTVNGEPLVVSNNDAGNTSVLTDQSPGGYKNNVQSQLAVVQQEIPETSSDPEESEMDMSYLSSLTIQLDNGLGSTDDLLSMQRKQAAEELSEQDRLIIAQNANRIQEVAETKGEKSWSLGATLAPSISLSQSSYSESYNNSMNKASGRSGLSMGGGLTLAMQSQSRWSVQTGVLYSRLGQSSSNSAQKGIAMDFANDAISGVPNYFVAGKTVGDDVVINGPVGKIVLNQLPQNAIVSSRFETVSTSSEVLMSSSDFDQQFDYLEIPLIVRYQLLDRQFDIQLMAGLNTGFLVRNSAYMSSGGSKTRIGQTSDMRSVIYAPSFGVGVGYALSPKLQLRFEPQLRYYIESLSKDGNVNYRPYTYGFYTGISYSF